MIHYSVVFSSWEAHRNSRLRRNLAVAARSGEGPFTTRFADLRHRAVQNRRFAEFTTYALAKPRDDELDEGIGIGLNEAVAQDGVAARRGVGPTKHYNARVISRCGGLGGPSRASRV